MEKLPKTKNTRFLPPTQDDQLHSDYQVGISRGPQYGFNPVAGGATITGGWVLIWI
jgi:hypothetical protein